MSEKKNKNHHLVTDSGLLTFFLVSWSSPLAKERSDPLKTSTELTIAPAVTFDTVDDIFVAPFPLETVCLCRSSVRGKETTSERRRKS